MLPPPVDTIRVVMFLKTLRLDCFFVFRSRFYTEFILLQSSPILNQVFWTCGIVRFKFHKTTAQRPGVRVVKPAGATPHTVATLWWYNAQITYVCLAFRLFIANNILAKQNGYWMRVIIDFQIVTATRCDDRRYTRKNKRRKKNQRCYLFHRIGVGIEETLTKS